MQNDQDAWATMEKADPETRKFIECFHFGWQLGDSTVSKISQYATGLKLSKKDTLKAEQIIANAIAICLLSDYLSMFAPEDIESVCKDVADSALEIVQGSKHDEEQNFGGESLDYYPS